MSVRIEHGDCLEVMKHMADEGVRIDSVVTDPPYHLTSIVKRFGKDGAAPAKSNGATGVYGRAAAGFMGQQWDGGDIAFRPETWRLAFDLLKPGGHMLVMGGARTYHRMACAVEDAGFEIRDQILWLYGSGFPKSHAVSKGIDRTAGKQWDGWGTALKPACEPIVLARRPLEGTVAANVLQHGTGALNIDGCRVGTFRNTTPPGTDRFNQTNHEHGYRPNAYQGNGRDGEASADRRYAEKGSTDFAATPGPRGGSPAGRWPANVIHDGSEEVLQAFAVSGESYSSGGGMKDLRKGKLFQGETNPNITDHCGFGDTGTAARFFYCAKADRHDRLNSRHPTVKPVDLIAYLCRLITPPGGLVLDPFAGSGTTAMAALREGFNAILIEKEARFVADIKRRLAHVEGADTPLFQGAPP